jgi:hypothetical protein
MSLWKEGLITVLVLIVLALVSVVKHVTDDTQCLIMQQIEPPPAEKPTAIDIDGEEADFGRLYLALVAFTEQNRHQPEGMDLVVRTVLNRLEDPAARFGLTIADVATQEGQYAGIEALRGPSNPARTDPERWAMALRAARRAIEGGVELPGPCASDKPILFFHSGDRPYWSPRLHLVCHVDGHYFYSEG